MSKHLSKSGVIALVGSVSLFSWSAFVPAEERMRVRVGFAQTLFRGLDEKVALAQAQPLTQWIGMKTGQNAEVALVSDVESLAGRLQEGRIQLAVVQGIEYGWARQKCAELRPLALICNESIELKVCVLIRREDSAREFADLRGKRLVMPRRVLDHNQLYLDQCLGKSGGIGFFSGTSDVQNTDEAIEQIVDGRADVTIIDSLPLDVYKKRKPGRFNKLRVLQESIAFPTAALIYHPGRMTEPDVAKFREIMLQADQGTSGRQMLTLWKISNFQPVSSEYEDLVASALKAFPKPKGATEVLQNNLAKPVVGK